MGADLVGRRTAAFAALISVAEQASRDQPGVAWDALSNAATVAYQSGTPASRQAVSRALDLLERQDPPPPDQDPQCRYRPAPALQMGAWTDPFGSRSELVRCLRQISRAPPARAAALLANRLRRHWLLGRIRRRRSADAAGGHAAAPGPGTQGTSGLGLTALGAAYIDTGRWDEALEACAELPTWPRANQMELVAAAADSDRGHRPGRCAPTPARPKARDQGARRRAI